MSLRKWVISPVQKICGCMRRTAGFCLNIRGCLESAGNGRKSGGTYAGAAPESSLIIVKLGEKGRESFARNTEIMRAVKYILDKAIELNMPVAINLSFGTNDGSHSGDSLFETYINDMANIWKCSICVASGNEGASGHHFSGKVMSDEVYETEIVISGGLKSLFISLWKNYTDKMNFELIAPGGESTGIIRYNADTVKYTFQTMSIYTNIGRPTPYSINQQVFFEIISAARHVKERKPAQLLPWGSRVAGQRHLMHPAPVRQFRKVQIFLDSRKHKIARPVNRTVPAGAGIRKADHPFNLRRVFLQQPDAHGNRTALGISRQIAVKSHPVQFQKLIPPGILHQSDDL